jgi:hypothetical protein
LIKIYFAHSRMKAILIIVALALAASLAWRYKDAGLVQSMAEQEEQARPTLQFDNGASVVPTDASPALGSASRSGIHKCKKGSVVTYTDAPCELGKHEQAMAGGTVTVVKGQRPAVSAPAAAGSQALLRTLAGNPNEPSLRDKAIERAVNPD